MIGNQAAFEEGLLRHGGGGAQVLDAAVGAGADEHLVDEDVVERLADPVEAFVDPAPLIASFNFARFGRAPARFDEAELAQLNARIIHQLPFEAVADRLPAGMDAAGWEAIRPNLETVAGAADWWTIVTGPLPSLPDDMALSEDDRAFLLHAADVAATIDWSGDPWHALTGALKDATGRKGKALFLPLRLALTARAHGPDMAALLPLIGREQAAARLTKAAQG